MVRTRTMPLEALRANADDPVGLDQIAATSTEPLQAFDPLQFDIWTVESSGAGVAVPSGATLTQQGNDCVADWGDSAVTLLISGDALDAPSLSPAWQSEVQSASVQFEQDWAVNFYPFIAENPQFSYLFGPRFPRPGMVVNRKLFQGRNPNNPIPYGIFETLMAKGDSFVGVAAIDRRFVPVAMLSQDQLNSVASAVFAVQLSTFPAQLK